MITSAIISRSEVSVRGESSLRPNSEHMQPNPMQSSPICLPQLPTMDDLADDAILRGSLPSIASASRTSDPGQHVRWFPEEHPLHQPPPSTSFPCPAWFCRLPRSFSAGVKLPSRKASLHFSCWAFAKFGQERQAARCSALCRLPDYSPKTRFSNEYLSVVLPSRVISLSSLLSG